MKKQLILMFAAAALLLGGCAGVDLSPLEKRLSDLESRLNTVEKTVGDMNTNSSSLKTAVEALEAKLTVTACKPVNGGWDLTLSNGDKLEIRNGVNGVNGVNGANGKDGHDGTSPTLGVKDVEGVLVWTVNGEPVLGPDGKPVPVSGNAAAPEFKYEAGAWYYRIGQGDWVSCGEGSGCECAIIETNDAFIIKIGDASVTLKKDFVSPAIESITNVITSAANRLFIPVGKSLDLTEWFNVTPEGALKTMVDYKVYRKDDQGNDVLVTEGLPFTISDKGVLTATAGGNTTVTIESKLDAKIKTTIVIRSAANPNDEVPEVSIDPAQKIMIFDGSLAEYNAMTNFSGTASWNPFNNSLAGIFNGGWNFRVGMSATENPNITMENGHVHMLFYVPDVSWLNPNDDPLFELTSGGANDIDEINWTIKQFATDLKNGWNEVDLKFSDAGPGPGTFDPTKANFIRLVNNSATTPDGAWATFQFKKIFVYAEDIPEPVNLSENGTANCYIVSEAGDYCFNATVMGVGEAGRRDGWYHTTSALAPASAALLWTDKDGAVSNVRLEDGKILFTVNKLQANAVVAAKDSNGNIIWSWHIWIDTIGEITDINSNANNYWGAATTTASVTILDRNLGAVGENGHLSRSFYYQYGRKDPFVFTGDGIATNLGFDVKTATAAQTIAYSVAHPQTFIGVNGDSDNAPWCSTAAHHSRTWGPDSFDVSGTPVFKTMYDPCPVGYMVFRPHDAACMFMAGSLSISDGHIVMNNGTAFKFPKEGWIYQSGAGICNDGGASYLWTACGENSGNQGYYFDGTNTNVKGPWNTTYSQASGRSVRCQKVY